MSVVRNVGATLESTTSSTELVTGERTHDGQALLTRESATMPKGFDIREWMRNHNVTLPANDPGVRKEISALLRRDLNERLAAYAERSGQNQDQNAPQNPGEPECSDAVSA
jgi:hypothetical protein